MKYTIYPFVFIGTLFTVGCLNFKETDPRTIHGVNNEFVPYINLYIKEKGLPLTYEIPMQFGMLDNKAVGRCTRWSNGYRQIVIDKTYWDNISIDENAKIELVFHELAHCDLNRGHMSTMLTNGKPASIMNPNNFMLLDSDKAYYFDELFVHPVN